MTTETLRAPLKDRTIGEIVAMLPGATWRRSPMTSPCLRAACRAWQALYLGTAKLVDDLIEHIHLENNVLFPRFEHREAV